MEKSFISAFLPEGILDHFEITSLKELGDLVTKKDGYYLYLEEKSTLPEGYPKEEYESKGFLTESTYKTFQYVAKRFIWLLGEEDGVISSIRIKL